MILFTIIFIWGVSCLLQSKIMPYVMSKVMAPYQVKRLEHTFKGVVSKENGGMGLGGKKKDVENYNVKQSVVAIGSGGFLGKGFLKNTQTRLDFVPEQSTDFIICSFAESFGFVGVIVLLLLYGFLLLRTLGFAEKQRSVFSRCYCYGFVSIVFFHVLVNIGMTIGLMPVIGIPLPFVSYGGGALITFSVMYFIVVRLDMDRQVVIK